MFTRIVKEMLIILLATFAGIYLMYPSLGIFEFIPDAVPIIGSIDEATATLIILNTLKYYGLDLTNLYTRGGKKKSVRRIIQNDAPQLEDGNEN